MADIASPFLIETMIRKNQDMLAGERRAPRGVSLYAVYKENIVLRAILAQHEAELAAAKAAKRKWLPFPSDLRPVR